MALNKQTLVKHSQAAFLNWKDVRFSVEDWSIWNTKLIKGSVTTKLISIQSK
jgi:hypothetical protein